MQDADAKDIPADVRDKLLRFARAAMAVALMRGKSYLSIGAVCMGIAGSIVDSNFFENYLGMRCEGVDKIEIIHRMKNDIYDKEEYKKSVGVGKEKLQARRRYH